MGTLNLADGANGFTSSATPSLLRSVTAQTVFLRVPTNSMLVDGATAMWRASGTTAYRSILKPGGSLTRLRFSRIASAFLPVCGTGGMFGSTPETFICLSFSMFWAWACALPATSKAMATVRVPSANEEVFFMLVSWSGLIVLLRWRMRRHGTSYAMPVPPEKGGSPPLRTRPV